MSDPYALWRAAEGMAKRKTIEIIFPELAAALGGAGRVTRAPLDVVATPGEPDPVPVDNTPPRCGYCRTAYAMGRMADDDTPVCLNCSAMGDRSKRRKVRNPAWRQWALDKAAADRAAAADPMAAWNEHERRHGRA